MNPPFTAEQFLDVITRYNLGTTPMPVALYLVAAAVIVLGLRSSRTADRWIIVTFGILLWAARPVPLRVLAIPAVWSVMGFTAALQFGIIEDFGLLVAGLLGTLLVVVKNRRLRAGSLEGAPAAA